MQCLNRCQAPQAASSSKPVRARMLAAVNIKWAKLRPDLRNDRKDLHDELCSFITDKLRLKEPLASLRSLSDRQLGRVLDVLSDMESQPPLPHSEATAAVAEREGATVIHLASAEQSHTINKIMDHLGWSQQARESFIKQRYRRISPAMLAPKQANGLTMILLAIAAARALKDRGGVSRVSRAMIRAEIPALKARLGIDRKDVLSASESEGK